MLENCAPCGFFLLPISSWGWGELASLYKTGEVFKENLKGKNIGHILSFAVLQINTYYIKKYCFEYVSRHAL